jgi:hypothetical protein
MLDAHAEQEAPVICAGNVPRLTAYASQPGERGQHCPIAITRRWGLASGIRYPDSGRDMPRKLPRKTRIVPEVPDCSGFSKESKWRYSRRQRFLAGPTAPTGHGPPLVFETHMPMHCPGKASAT